MRVRVAAVIAAIVLVAAVAAFLLSDGSNVAYDNGKQVKVGAAVGPGDHLCQPASYVPKGAGALRIWVDTNGRRGGPIDVRVTEHGTLVTSGHAPGGYVNAPVTIPMSTVRAEHFDAEVCIQNEGNTEALYMGDSPGPGEADHQPPLQIQRHGPDPELLAFHQEVAVVDSKAAQPFGPVVVRMEWHFPGSSTRAGLMPTLAQRISLDKASFVGSWTFWLLAVLMIAAGVAAVRISVREAAE